jgi:hypothetical protein
MKKTKETVMSVTENGMPTNPTSMNACVDLFGTIGAMRGSDQPRIVNKFNSAYAEHQLTALKLLFWSRDVRGGAGERQLFRYIIKNLATNFPDVMLKNIHLIPEYGRWDDVLELFGTKLEQNALELIANALNHKNIEMAKQNRFEEIILVDANGLCAKWMPRKGENAIKIERYLGLTPKQYRKLVSSLTVVVEQFMCANKWTEIEYKKVPSLAMSRYIKSFSKHDKDGMAKYIEMLKKGKTKINASALYPYDVLKSLTYSGNDDINDAQWAALPNYMEGSTELILPMCDISGSMRQPAGDNPNVDCMDVCISLGLYIAEHNVGAFQNMFLTFASEPRLQLVSGNNLRERLYSIRQGGCASTNIVRAFEVLLDTAVKNRVPASQMPTMVLILSDMEFDEARTGSHGNGRGHEDNWNNRLIAQCDRMYREAGYALPKLIFWNIQARSDKNMPVLHNEMGTAIVSGASPSVLKSVLSAKNVTPYDVMIETLYSDRYQPVTL